eukprot:CAMPEP_0116151934 /NCGR_PEP_ID=MMETSP0329-20121206/20376_1 /TAXON_ID=697910 /ORGANISM="Pseudo-nitzschia arenysensis, Strain B593" /LENGTH=494 /DNA_ID=CAMNT_0003648609 /DNA_START=162 /DNA_END=1646 /DNA_ORIENTATION=+
MSRRDSSLEANGEVINENNQSSDRTISAAEAPNEPSAASRSSASIGEPETMNENSGTTNTSNNDDDGVDDFGERVNARLDNLLRRETENIHRATDLLQGLSNRAISRAAEALQRTRALAINASSAEQAASSSSPTTSLEQRLQQRMLQRQERSRQRAERAAERRERSRERRSRRRLRASSSEENNEELAARRRRRAHNVVASLQDIMLVPTSSTLGENSTDAGTTSRSNGANDASAANAPAAAAAAAPSENPNNNGNESANDPRRAESQEGGSRPDVDNNDSEIRVFRRRGQQRREAIEMLFESESDDDSSYGMNELIANGTGFELGSLVDRDRILNNLMQRSISMLRDVEGASSARQRSTDLKCPVCNEIFVDYEASDHPNAPGSRSGSTRCSHGAMSLFTKLHQCPICFEENIEAPNVVALACGHVLCKEDFCRLGGHVGADRPSGCSRAQPLPSTRPSRRRSSGRDNNNSSTTSSSTTENNGPVSLGFNLF